MQPPQALPFVRRPRSRAFARTLGLLPVLVVFHVLLVPVIAVAQPCDLESGWPLGEWVSGPLFFDSAGPLTMLAPNTGVTALGSTATFLVPLVPGQSYVIEYVSTLGEVSTETGILDPIGCTMLRTIGEQVILGRTWTADGNAPTEWIRGDVNNDGHVDIADPIALLQRLYPTPALPVDASPSCTATDDANDDGTTNIADAVMILGVLFSGEPMPAPYPTCGPDPTSPDLAACPAYWSCP